MLHHHLSLASSEQLQHSQTKDTQQILFSEHQSRAPLLVFSKPAGLKTTLNISDTLWATHKAPKPALAKSPPHAQSHPQSTDNTKASFSNSSPKQGAGARKTPAEWFSWDSRSQSQGTDGEATRGTSTANSNKEQKEGRVFPNNTWKWERS